MEARRPTAEPSREGLLEAPPTPAVHDRGLARVLGPVDATCVVVGAIIGVGIFFTPSRVVRVAGSGELALLAWAVGGFIALMGALTFAQLGTMYPRTGGQYDILRDAYGPLPAFLFVFCNASAVQAGAMAIIALVCAQNLGLAIGGTVPGGTMLSALSSLLIVGLVAANAAGIRWGSGIQNLTAFAKVGTLVAVALLAAGTGPAEPAADPASSAPPAHGAAAIVAGLFAAVVPAFFAYGGWQHALWIAGEVRQPRRNLPLAIIGGVTLVVFVYLLTNWAYLRLLGAGGVAESQALAAEAVAVVWPALGERAVAGAVAVSAFGVLNAQLLSGPRLIYRMAADGRFFQRFARVSTRFGTPHAAIVLLGGLALALLFISGQRALDRLLTGVVFVDGVFFVLTGLAALVLGRRQREGGQTLRRFGYPLVPALFVLGETGVVLGAYGDASARSAAYVGTAWIAAGAACYFLFFRGRRGTPGDAAEAGAAG